MEQVKVLIEAVQFCAWCVLWTTPRVNKVVHVFDINISIWYKYINFVQYYHSVFEMKTEIRTQVINYIKKHIDFLGTYLYNFIYLINPNLTFPLVYPNSQGN